MTLSISFIPELGPPECKSVEMESGRKPSATIGTATRQVKLPASVPHVEDHTSLAAFKEGEISVSQRV